MLKSLLLQCSIYNFVTKEKSTNQKWLATYLELPSTHKLMGHLTSYQYKTIRGEPYLPL